MLLSATASRNNQDTRHTACRTHTRTLVQLIFPASLSARQRAAVHAIGERHGLPHSSQGEGAERHIVLGPSGAPAVVLGEPAGDGAASVQPALSDDQLAALIKQHLQLEVAEEFASKPGSSNGGGDGARRPPVGGGPWRRAEAAAAAKPGSRGLVTPEEFIARVLPLLDMEREAEVAQVPWEGPQPLRVHLACLPACRHLRRQHCCRASQGAGRAAQGCSVPSWVLFCHPLRFL